MNEGNRSQKTELLPRYLRVVYPTRSENGDNLPFDRLCSENTCTDFTCQRLKWLPDFLALSGDIPLSKLKTDLGIDHKQEGLFPMDISSALAVLSLDIDPTVPKKVLDLCCSPGAKFQMILEKLHNDSVIMGVDISEQRLTTCTALLEYWQSSFSKQESYGSPSEMLFHCDGTLFGANHLGNLVFNSGVYFSELSHQKDRKRKNKSAKNRIQNKLQTVQRELEAANRDINTSNSSLQCCNFDYVLVDAECTHDASYRHMKYVDRGFKFEKKQKEPLSNQQPHRRLPDQRGGNTKRRKNQEGYFVYANKDDEDADEEQDWWDEECTAEDVQQFIEQKEQTLAFQNRGNGNENGAHNDQLQIHNKAAGDGGAVIPVGELQKTLTLSHNIRDLKTSLEGRKKLENLQRSLILNGFTLLRSGGVLVYSTCSEEEEQNEDIVRWLLSTESTAVIDSAYDVLNKLGTDEMSTFPKKVEDLTTTEEMVEFVAAQPKPLLLPGTIEGTVRVNYSVGMSGHFIARIRKLEL
jgi:16S rRNA C967 or C1407 C5-methylase (RsmB/RsmF family)